ncbi:hypothetical protein F8M41_014765 [Gigaspora margarita]|uniref:Uncharacterized protein n=1 Tax=Gigaspora margarita TaxID=4874 RepID=A0A8H3WX47_GIGMA|nr:hypothetical protein F8M41_014765 [Gigaspora margarita]
MSNHNSFTVLENLRDDDKFQIEELKWDTKLKFTVGAIQNFKKNLKWIELAPNEEEFWKLYLYLDLVACSPQQNRACRSFNWYAEQERIVPFDERSKEESKGYKLRVSDK